jgi:hypothetical protein
MKSAVLFPYLILSALLGSHATLAEELIASKLVSSTGLFVSQGAFKLLAGEKAQAGIVKSVDQSATGDTEVWVYTAAEAGDYQLGMAWVEVLSGESVKVEITCRGNMIREMVVPASKLPTRMETRVPDVEQGDRIAVKATPMGDAQYRLGYQLAITTPTFPEAKIFNVADFGALGNGVSDDMAAIHLAVEAARRAGAGVIRFEPNRSYRCIGRDNLEQEFVFPLKNAFNVKIEGNGATLILHPPDGLVQIDSSRNIHLDGLFVAYDPLPYYQGEITDINVENMTIDIVVPDRYPVPQTGETVFDGPFFGRSFIPEFKGARSGDGNNIYIDSVTPLTSDRHLRIQVPGNAKGSDSPNAGMLKRVQRAKDEGATEFVVPHILYGHHDGTSYIHSSSRIKISNTRWYCVPYFWLSIRQNYGPVTLYNTDLQMKHPETELLASWRDGLHIKNSRFGLTIEGADMDGAAMYDDTFAIYSRSHRVLGVDGRTLHMEPVFRDHKDIETWYPGDWVSVWNQDQTYLRGMSRLIEKRDVREKNEFFLTLETIPSGAGAEDILINEEVLNRNTLIRDCRTTDVGTEYASNRFRATDIHFENNHFDDFAFHVEFDGFWGTPRSRNVMVKDTFISSQNSTLTLSWPIGVTFQDCIIDNTTVVCHKNAEDILFNSVQWTNAPEKFLKIGPGSGVTIMGDSQLDGGIIEQDSQAVLNRLSIHQSSSIDIAPR